MKRTNISLEEWQHTYLKQRARQEDTSMSAIIREMVEQYAEERGESTQSDPIHDVIGSGNSGEGDIARDHDRHIYRDDTNDRASE